MLSSIRQSLDVLSERNDGPIAFSVEKILDSFARAGLVVNVKDAVFHLDMVARQTDYSLDVIGGIVGRQFENCHVATVGGMEQYPPGEQRQPERQRKAAIPVREFRDEQ